MRGLAVGTYSNNFCPQIRERFVGVAEAASLGCTAPGEVLRIEVKDNVPLSKEILQSNVTAIAGWQAEIRSLVSYGEQFLYLRVKDYGQWQKRLALIIGSWKELSVLA